MSWIAAVAVVVATAPPAVARVWAQQPNTAGLRIVVVEGEDAVNIIQQKTAVAPIVEVRDRNNLPVSGATVTFTIGQGGSFAGQSTLTVVTNAAGQATATGLTPSAAGAIQIQATATFQGQTAIATIAQSNVLTAAEAAATTAGAGGSGGGGGGATGAAGGAGGGAGGISGATLGIIGGAVAGGAVVATQAGGGGDDSPGASSTTPSGSSATTPTTPSATTPPPSTPSQPSSSSFSGPIDGTFSGTSTVTVDGASAFSCNYSVRNTGNATLRTQTAAGGAITGTLDMNGTQTPSVISCTGGFSYPIPAQPFTYSVPVTGSASALRASQEFRDSGNVEGASFTVVATVTFTGTLSGNTVTGSITWNSTADIRADGGTSRATWTGTINLNLR
jgi:hypothetical protein